MLGKAVKSIEASCQNYAQSVFGFILGDVMCRKGDRNVRYIFKFKQEIVLKFCFLGSETKKFTHHISFHFVKLYFVLTLENLRKKNENTLQNLHCNQICTQTPIMKRS